MSGWKRPASFAPCPATLSILNRSADVPVQYFQSVITTEVAVIGAVLWQIRYFEPRDPARRDGERLRDPRLRLGLGSPGRVSARRRSNAAPAPGRSARSRAGQLGLAQRLLRVAAQLARVGGAKPRSPHRRDRLAQCRPTRRARPSLSSTQLQPAGIEWRGLRTKRPSRFSGAFLAHRAARFGLLEPNAARPLRSTEPKVRGSNPLGRVAQRPSGARRGGD